MSRYYKGICTVYYRNIISAIEDKINTVVHHVEWRKNTQESKYSKPKHGTSGSPKGTPKRAPNNRHSKRESGPKI